MSRTKSKYKLRIAQVLPQTSEEELFEESRCVLGVSMTNPVFWRSSLNDLVEWMSQHFEESMVLVGDYLHRLNAQILTGEGEEAAAIQALAMGEEFMERLKPALRRVPEGAFVVQRWKPFHDDPGFWEAKREMDALYRENASVKASIDSTASLFVRQKTERDAFRVDKKLAVELSAQYLLEEMAVFSLLINRGWKVVVYPGAQLPLLMEIATGRFKDVPNHLHQGIYVELNVRKK